MFSKQKQKLSERLLNLFKEVLFLKNLKKIALLALCGCLMLPSSAYAEETDTASQISDLMEQTTEQTPVYNESTETETENNQITDIDATSDTPTLINAEDSNVDEQICTVNIRCYPQQEVYDYQETIFCYIYPIDGQNESNTEDYPEPYSLNLNALNNYRDSINVAPGEYYVVATVEGNNGYFRFYMPNDSTKLTCLVDQPISVACAFGDEDFINKIKGYLPVADIYKDETTDSLLQKTPVEIEESTNEEDYIALIDLEENTESATETATFDAKESDSNSKTKREKWFWLKLTAAFIVLFLLIRFALKKKN